MLIVIVPVPWPGRGGWFLFEDTTKNNSDGPLDDIRTFINIFYIFKED